MLAVKIAATGDQQPVIGGKFRIIAIMPLFMIIAEGLDAVDAGIDCFLQQIFPLIKCLERMRQHGDASCGMDLLHRRCERRIVHMHIQRAARLTLIPKEIHRRRITAAAAFAIGIKIADMRISRISEHALAHQEPRILISSIMEDLLQVYDDVDAVFVCNEDGAFGVYAALEAAGRTDIGIYTVDGSANGVAMVLEGHITGIAAQQPYLMGYEAADQMIRYFNGEETTLDFALGIEYITSENASTWEGY